MANSRELAEQAFSILQDALKDSEARAAELDAELRKQKAPKSRIEHQARVLEHRLESVEAECEKWRREAARLGEVLENDRAKIKQLKKKLDVAESGPDKVDKKEVNYWRSRADQFDNETKEYKKRIAELRKTLKERPEAEAAADTAALAELEASLKAAETARAEAEAEIGKRESRLAELQAQIDEQDGRLAALQTQIDERDSRLAARDTELAALKSEAAELRGQLDGHDIAIAELKAQNNQLNSDLADKHSELTEIKTQLKHKDAELAERARTLTERDQRISDLAEARRQAEEARQAIRDQIAGLEGELKEEKECTVNLSEIANERREQITELSEKLDEAQERYEEAKWRLEGAARFERLVIKRRKLIDSLIAAIRGKQKANTALKAGLDGLRKFKAKSEQQQQKLLIRVDELATKLSEAEERLASRKSSKEADEKLRKAAEMISGLEERLDAQVQVIDNLENDLATAKAARKSAENNARELGELKSALQARDATIEKLEAEIDEQLKQLGKLRGSESETTRLKAVKMQDQSTIDALTEQVESLKAELAQQQLLADGGAEAAAQSSAAEIRKRDSQIADLKRAIKDQEKEIAKLNEAVAGWQKKYEFLSTEPPSAYQSAVAEK